MRALPALRTHRQSREVMRVLLFDERDESSHRGVESLSVEKDAASRLEIGRRAGAEASCKEL